MPVLSNFAENGGADLQGADPEKSAPVMQVDGG